MSNSLWVDHHADFAGWKQLPQGVETRDDWSPRRSACYFVACALLSWTLFLSPLLFVL